MPSSSSQPTVSSRMPALLEPHVASGPLAQEQGSLTLLTWVQGASANWLVLRYLYALLLASARDEHEDEGQQPATVVLVSFLRDFKFWADGCTRLGMDLDALRKSGRFCFVDGLTGLFSPVNAAPGAADGLVIGGGAGGHSIDAIKTRVDAALAGASTNGRRILVVDGLDAYVAMTQAGSGPAAESLLMSLRENVFSTLVTVAADEPLMKAATGQQQRQHTTSTTTTLEREHAALVLGQAHAADQVVSLRRLDTGAAADVSGVMRVATRSRAAAGAADDDAGEELLYHVAGDGGLRVFERGA